VDLWSQWRITLIISIAATLILPFTSRQHVQMLTATCTLGVPEAGVDNMAWLHVIQDKKKRAVE